MKVVLTHLCTGAVAVLAAFSLARWDADQRRCFVLTVDRAAVETAILSRFDGQEEPTRADMEQVFLRGQSVMNGLTAGSCSVVIADSSSMAGGIDVTNFVVSKVMQ